MHKDFDITTTATLRPELLKRTFDSHIKYLFGDQIKNAHLHINIDYAGCDKDLVLNKLNEIFTYLSSLGLKEVNINTCEVPHFPSAFCWCMNQIGHPLTFHLEEDWELNKPIDFEDMIRQFELNNDLVHLRLSAFNSTEKHQIKCWNKFCEWNGSWYEVPQNLRGTIGWAGHPSLNRTSFLLYFAKKIDKSKNPEKQIKGNYPIIRESRFGIYHKQLSPKAVIDIGREWMVKNSYVKKGNKAWFTNWRKAEKGE